MFEGSKINSIFSSQDIDILNSVLRNGNKFNSELSRSLKMQTSLIAALGKSYKDAQIYLNKNIAGHLTMFEMKKKELANVQKSNAATIRLLEYNKARTKSESKALELEEKIYNLRAKEKTLERDISSRNTKIQNMYAAAKQPTLGTVVKANVMSKIPGLAEAAELMTVVKRSGLPELLGTVLVISTLIIGVLKTLIGQVVDGVKAFRDFGFTASQIGDLAKPSIEILSKLTSNGVFASLEEIDHSIGQISADIGKAAKGAEVGGLVQTSLTMQKIWAVNEGVANRFAIALYRISGGNTKYVESARSLVGTIARSNGISAQTVVQGMAENMEIFYKSTDKSVGAFARMIVHAKNLGVQVSTLTNLQEKFSTDFEGTLEAQATIQAFQPGVNLAPAINAANFGNSDQFLSAVKTAVDSIRGFDTMATGYKVMLARGFGMSVEELTNIKKGNKELAKVEGQPINDVVENFKTSMIDILTGRLDKAVVALGAISAATTYMADLFGRSKSADTGYNTMSANQPFLYTAHFKRAVEAEDKFAQEKAGARPELKLTTKHGEVLDYFIARDREIARAKGQEQKLGNPLDTMNHVPNTQNNDTDTTSDDITATLKSLESTIGKFMAKMTSPTVQLNIDGRKIGEAVVNANSKR